MPCSICKQLQAISVEHDSEGCPFAPDIVCRRCHHRGHLTSACTEVWHEAPTTLEELIPWSERRRWGITSHTPFSPSAPRGSEEALEETPDINELRVPDSFKELTGLLDTLGVKVEKKTKPSEESCMKALKAYAVAHGKRLIKASDVLG